MVTACSFFAVVVVFFLVVDGFTVVVVVFFEVAEVVVVVVVVVIAVVVVVTVVDEVAASADWDVASAGFAAPSPQLSRLSIQSISAITADVILTFFDIIIPFTPKFD